MEPTEFECMLAVLGIFYGIFVGAAYQLFLMEGSLLAVRFWKGLLYPGERILMLLLAPVTVVGYGLCSLFSGLRFGGWVESKLEARAAAHREERKLPEERLTCP